MYIANRAFVITESSLPLTNTAKFLYLAFKMKKLKTKYKNLAQSKSESALLSTALLAIYETLCAS